MQEPGTIDCHIFIECKEQIEKMLLRLYKLENTEHICNQLKSVHQLIEGMHDLKKSKRKSLADQSSKRLKINLKSY